MIGWASDNKVCQSVSEILNVHFRQLAELFREAFREFPPHRNTTPGRSGFIYIDDVINRFEAFPSQTAFASHQARKGRTAWR
jgi:hypothetical protein